MKIKLPSIRKKNIFSSRKINCFALKEKSKKFLALKNIHFKDLTLKRMNLKSASGSLPAKMFFINAFLLLLTLGLIGISVDKINKANKATEQIRLQAEQTMVVLKIQATVNQQLENFKEYIFTNNENAIQHFYKLDHVSNQLMLDLKIASKRNKAGLDTKDMAESYTKMKAMWEIDILPMVKSGDREAAVRVLANHGEPLFQELNNKINKFVEMNEGEMRAVQERATREGAAARKMLIVFGSLAVSLGTIVSLVLTRAITRPLKHLASGAKVIATGDLSVRVEAGTGDEIGELAGSFNHMVEGLRRLVAKLVESSAALGQYSKDLSVVSEKVDNHMEAIAATTSRLASDTGRGASEAAAASLTSAETENVARMGNQAVQKTVAKMAGIQAVVNDSVETVKELEQYYRQIQQINLTVTNIADQTNLIALNAAIEAARAGEHGRGFAVVADEVRKLAEKSALATKEIGGIIRHINEKTGAALQVMEKGSLEVNEGVLLAEKAGESLNQIIEEVNRSVDIIKAISMSLDNASEGIHSLAASSQQVSSTIHEIIHSVRSLAAMAEDFQSLVGSFKLH